MKSLKNRYGWRYALIFILLISGCKEKHPEEVLSETQMEKLLYDYHLAKAVSEDLPYNDNYKKQLYIDYVFQKHKITEAVFDSSMVWYTRHTEVLAKIYEKINKRFKNQQEEIDRLISLHNGKSKISLTGDSVDVWTGQRVSFLTGYPLNNKITFLFPSDKNFEKRDSLLWQAHYRFFDSKPADSAMLAVMSMQVVYDNDSVVSMVKKVLTSGKESIGLKSDTLNIKEIRGFIYFSKKDTLERKLLIDSLALMRYHHHANDTVSKIENDTVEQKRPEETEKEFIPPSLPVQQERKKPEEFNQRRIEKSNPRNNQDESKKK
ncbi:hypothetical protein EZS27_022931 [termite gut metagenome]|uniref:DUF4296 domain-containing protein n=1 Tax=termite gut metagenome TaxID=433724 RepID=A0A5J4R4B1_9ZZZZ